MKHMKHLFIALAAGFAATFAAAQIPMPAWELSEAVERQSGVMNYTNEKFDFRRLPMHRSISEFLHPGDTVQYRTFLFDVTVCDAWGPVSQLRFQSDPQVVRKEADTVTFVAADNAWLQVVALAHLPLDASDELVRHAVDSLKDIRTITDGMDILPAKQCGMSYALQYLFGRAGIDAEPLLSWQTYLSSDKAAELLGYCCEPVRKMRIGGDIERFARKAEFSDEYIYLLEGNGERKMPVAFFCSDGKFWAKIGPCQYLSFDSVISVWRHDKKTTHVGVYRLKGKFR